MILVCDTNVLISAALFPGSSPDKIVRSILSGRFLNVTSPDLLTEFKRILLKKFRLEQEKVEEIADLILANSRMVYPAERLRVVANDEADNRVLECAVAGRADVIVTGDKKHLLPLGLYKSIRILAPRDFCERYIVL